MLVWRTDLQLDKMVSNHFSKMWKSWRESDKWGFSIELLDAGIQGSVTGGWVHCKWSLLVGGAGSLVMVELIPSDAGLAYLQECVSS